MMTVSTTEDTVDTEHKMHMVWTSASSVSFVVET